MVFRTCSASDSLSTLGSTALLISIEDQTCLERLAGWEPDFSEENDIAPILAPAKRVPMRSQHSKEVGEKPAVITNGLDVERVKRKILVDGLDELPPGKTVANGAICGTCVSSPGHKTRSSGSKRPRSLPDFRNHVVEDQNNDGVIPHNGKESVAKEDRRLRSLISSSHKSLQKGSPVSRSLNSIADISSQGTSFRDRLGVQDLRNRSVHLCSPSQTKGVDIPDKQSGVASNKRRCVRRLNLDSGISSSQNSAGVDRNKLQPSVQRQIAGVLSSEQHALDKVASKSAMKKQQLCSSAVYQHNDGNLSSNVHRSKQSTGCSQSRNSPESYQHYRIGPETQRVILNNFGDDSFCISEKLTGDSNVCVASSSSHANVGQSGDLCKDDNSQINCEADNLQTSEELFSGTQGSLCGDRPARNKSSQQDESTVSQRTESLFYCLKNLSTKATAVHSSDVRPQGLTFTKSQIKSMCSVISRLYGSQE